MGLQTEKVISTKETDMGKSIAIQLNPMHREHTEDKKNLFSKLPEHLQNIDIPAYCLDVDFSMIYTRSRNEPIDLSKVLDGEALDLSSAVPPFRSYTVVRDGVMYYVIGPAEEPGSVQQLQSVVYCFVYKEE